LLAIAVDATNVYWTTASEDAGLARSAPSPAAAANRRPSAPRATPTGSRRTEDVYWTAAGTAAGMFMDGSA
jgi:hypothetical protein